MRYYKVRDQNVKGQKYEELGTLFSDAYVKYAKICYTLGEVSNRLGTLIFYNSTIYWYYVKSN